MNRSKNHSKNAPTIPFNNEEEGLNSSPKISPHEIKECNEVENEVLGFEIKSQKKYDEKKIDLVQAEISPELAASWLKNRNKQNRKASPGHIQNLSFEMKNGNWVDYVALIAIDYLGFLANGQHTLSAIVNSGRSQKVILAIYVDSEYIKFADIGRKRNPFESNEIANRDEMWMNSNNFGSLAAPLVTGGFTKKRIGKTQTPTPSQKLEARGYLAFCCG